MSHMADRELWEKRYETPEFIHGADPSDYLRANCELLPRSGLALDLAAGEGRNALYLAERGLEVIALDISIRALEKCRQVARARRLEVYTATVDLTQFLIPQNKFDVIVNFNYLQRDLAENMAAGLRSGGLLIFETLTTRHLRWKPDFNPEFLLSPGQLAGLFPSLRLIKYRETDMEVINTGRRSMRAVASLVARKD